MSRVHRLKTWPSYFEAVIRGAKSFEVRVNDRDFVVGDEIVLEEWDPTRDLYSPRGYTGRKARRKITYVMPGGRFGVAENYVVLSLLELLDG